MGMAPILYKVEAFAPVIFSQRENVKISHFHCGGAKCVVYENLIYNTQRLNHFHPFLRRIKYILVRFELPDIRAVLYAYDEVIPVFPAVLKQLQMPDMEIVKYAKGQYSFHDLSTPAETRRKLLADLFKRKVSRIKDPDIHASVPVFLIQDRELCTAKYADTVSVDQV